MSNSLWSHGLQHASLPCPSPSPGVCSNLRPLSQWCHPAISSSLVPFSSCPQSFPASGSFPTSQLFTSGGQSIGASAGKRCSWSMSSHLGLAKKGSQVPFTAHGSPSTPECWHSNLIFRSWQVPTLAPGPKNLLSLRVCPHSILSHLFISWWYFCVSLTNPQVT